MMLDTLQGMIIRGDSFPVDDAISLPTIAFWQTAASVDGHKHLAHDGQHR